MSDNTGKVRDGVWRALGLLEHLHMMALLFLLGLTIGLTFYVFTRAVYQSRAIIRFDIAQVPLHQDGSVDRKVEDSVNVIQLRDSLASLNMVERTAKRIGLTDHLGNYETIRDRFVPKIDVSLTDPASFRVDVFAYQPEIVSKWQIAMVEEYEKYSRERRREQRELRIRLYQEELDALTKRINDQWREKLTFEEENSITELFVQQAGLTQVPKEMVTTRQKITQMDQVRKSLSKDNIGSLEVLSILSAYKDKPESDLVPGLFPAPGRGMESLENLVPQGTAQRPEVVMVVPPDKPDAAWVDLDKARQPILAQINELGKRYLPGHQKMRELQQDLERINDALAESALNMRQRFEAEYDQLVSKLQQLEKQLPDFRGINRTYEEFRQSFALKQNRNIAWADAYKEIAKRLTTMEYNGDGIPVHLDFVGYTLMRDQDPVSPGKLKLLLLSIGLGIGLALGVPLTILMLNDTMTRMDDAQEILNLVGLGVVPVYSRVQLEDIVRSTRIDASHPNRLLEDFRLIRSSIALNRDVEIGTQAIMVTSARPKEGKSTIAANLAWAFASMGDKTLVVDCDLRRGRLHRIFDVSNTAGISDVLSKGANWQEFVQTTKLAGLDVLTRGPFIPGVTEGLCQESFKSIVDQWRRTYKRIIFDTPPVLGLSEASSLQRLVDGTVVVVLAERTSKRDVEYALDTLRKSGGRIYGFILNRLDLKKAANYYQYSYYSPYYYADGDNGDLVKS